MRVLFNVCADAENYNAQSLNAREIALRLDPTRFRSTLFFEKTPDPRLLEHEIRLVKLPERRRTFRILREMLAGYDAILYIDLSPASYAFLHLPRPVRRSRAVLSIEGTRGNLDGVSRMVRSYADYVVHHSDVLVAISEFVARDAEDLSGMRSDFIIPVGVDTRLFHPPAAREHSTLTVLFVGHLLERKGADLVVEAAKQLPGVHFRMIGATRGEFGEKLRERSRSIPNVSFDDPMRQGSLAEAMRDSDLLLHPSRVEGVPKVTLEAAATGLPCIVFDDYETPSVIDGLTGFQVKTFNEMLARLKALVEDSGLRQRMGAAAVTHAKAFDWDEVAGKWAETLELVVTRRRHAKASVQPEKA